MDILVSAKKLLNDNRAYIIDYENLSKLLEYKEIILDKMYYKSLFLRYSKEEKIVALLKELETEILNENLIKLKEIIDNIVLVKSKMEDKSLGCIIKKIKDDEGYIEGKAKKLGYSYLEDLDLIFIYGVGSYTVFKEDDKNSDYYYVVEYKEYSKFNLNDVKIDLFHSDGAGGQNVNKVESGVRATHLLTEIVVTCKDERSQLFNKGRALEKLEDKVNSFYEKEIKEYVKKEIKKVYGKNI